jgi:hypothetical protein
LKVYRPLEHYWKPPLRQAATPLCASGAVDKRRGTTEKMIFSRICNKNENIMLNFASVL